MNSLLIESDDDSIDNELVGLDEFIPKYKEEYTFTYLPKLINSISNIGIRGSIKFNPLQLMLTTNLPKSRSIKDFSSSLETPHIDLISIDIDYLFNELYTMIQKKEHLMIQEFQQVSIDDFIMSMLKRQYIFNTGIQTLDIEGNTILDRTEAGKYYKIIKPIMKVLIGCENNKISENLNAFINFILKSNSRNPNSLDNLFKTQGSFNGYELELFRYFLCYMYVKYNSTVELSHKVIHLKVPNVMYKFYPNDIDSILDIITEQQYLYYFRKINDDEDEKMDTTDNNNLIYSLLYYIGKRVDDIFSNNSKTYMGFKYVSDEHGFILDELLDLIEEMCHPDDVTNMLEYVKNSLIKL